MAIAITLIAGSAVFGWVNSQAGVSEQQYGNAVQGNISYLEERFVVTQIDYHYNGCTSSCTSTTMTIYIYNDGQIADQFAQIEIYAQPRSALDVTYDASYVAVHNPSSCSGQTPASASNESPMLGTGSTSFLVSQGSISSITLTLSTCSGLTFQQGTTYVIQVLGRYGNSVAYSQTM